MWMVAAYYTDGLYAGHAAKLVRSMDALHVSHDVVQVPDLGNWQANIQFKPTFIKQMLPKHAGENLVYTDADSEFLRYPALFDDLDARPDVNIAVHILDHLKYKKRTRPPELLSGTIWVRNNDETSKIIDEWIEECRKDPLAWDQVALEKVLKNHQFHTLPDRYVCIYDYMSSVPDKVIVHYQASRSARRLVVKQPVRTVNPGDIKIRPNH